MISPHETARKYAGARPGFELIEFLEVGIPFYRLQLDALVQRQKPVGPIEEFVLRSVDAGLDSIADVSGLLGLDRVLVERSVVELSRQDQLDYRVQDDRRVLKITSQGQKALAGWREFLPNREELYVGFDRLLWKVTGRHFRALLRPRDAREAGLTELPPRRTRRVDSAELDLDQTERAIGEILRTSMQELDLLSVIDVGNFRMVLPAVALVFASTDDGHQQVGIAVDGRMSEAHGLAFAEIDGPKRVGLVAEGIAGEDERPELPADVLDRRVGPADVARLEAQIAGAVVDLDRAETETATAAGSGTPEEQQDAQAALDRSAEAVGQARKKLGELPVRSIQTYEHRALLEEALSTAERRLLIISPWIRGDVVNSGFLARLRARAERKVAIHIGWGIDDTDDDRGRDAAQRLSKLSDEFDTVSVNRLGNTHAKVLIWDDHLVVTSFNWLSFSGDPRRRFRQEEGTLITDASYVEQEYTKYSEQITSAR